MDKETRQSIEEATKRYRQGYELLSEAETLGIEVLVRPEIEYKGKSKSYKLWKVELTGRFLEKIIEKYGEQILENLIGKDKNVGSAMEDLFSKMRKIGVYNFLYSKGSKENNETTE